MLANFFVKEINDLLNVDLTTLKDESIDEGFQFIEKLLTDYQNGNNRFNQDNEVLFGIFDANEQIIAIGGINIDPFLNSAKIGRVRRFYVRPQYRKFGLGKHLLQAMITYSKSRFELLVLRSTNTEQANHFYQNNGFSVKINDPNYTHFMQFK